jgi:hypothetical protein
MVVMADAGDRDAQLWCLTHMKPGQIRRTSRRCTFARERQATTVQEA